MHHSLKASFTSSQLSSQGTLPIAAEAWGMFHLARKSMSKGSGVSIEEKGGCPPRISSRIGRSGGDSNALETYDVVGVYYANPPARRKPFTPVISRWDLNPRHALPRSVLALNHERVAGLPTELLPNGDGRSRTAVRTGLAPKGMGDTGFEPVTSTMSRCCATAAPIARGGNGKTRTCDLPVISGLLYH